MSISNLHLSNRRPWVVAAGPQKKWTAFEKIFFRLFFIYFLLQSVPLDWKYYRQLLSVSWTHLHYIDLFNVYHYTPQFFSGLSQSYADWLVILLIAAVGAAIWTSADRGRTKEYSVLYYWIRVIVRYRLAIAIIGYGMIKLFPLQAPYPSISNLNTAYGDFTRWKLFSLSLGIVPTYESFLGLVEIVFGLLLLFRKTASIAAFLIIIFTGNVFMSNIAYEGGESTYAFYIISLAIFLLAFDAERIIRLLIWQKPTTPASFRPVYSAEWLKRVRTPLKVAFVLFFVVLYGFKTGADYAKDSYHFPKTKGLERLSGIYNVSTFSINKDTLAYSQTDTTRWQDVVFEKWNTISIRSNRTVLIDSNNIEKPSSGEKERNYELEGTVGRHYYSYLQDTVDHVLHLQNKNPHCPDDSLALHYDLANNGTIVLSGANRQNDSVYVVLNKIDKKYLVQEAARAGRRGRLKL